jgi:hypothetical protein
VWEASLLTIRADLNFSELNLDGSHAVAKKGGESVAYQGRKRAKTTNILPITDMNGFIVASTQPIAGNHNDAFHLKPHLQTAFKFMKRQGLDFQGAYFNADSAFDTKAARKVCFNHGASTNIVFPVSAPLPGSTNSELCSSVLIARMCTSWVATTSLSL